MIRFLNEVEEPLNQLFGKQAKILRTAVEALKSQGFTEECAQQMVMMRGLDLTGISTSRPDNDGYDESAEG